LQKNDYATNQKGGYKKCEAIHLLVDFDAKYRFGNAISCRLHDWNLDLKLAKISL
jgi:hypothetical protein